MASIIRTIVTLYLFIGIVEFTTALSINKPITAPLMEQLIEDLKKKGLWDESQGHGTLQFQGVAISEGSTDYGSATPENLNTITGFSMRLRKQQPEGRGGAVGYNFEMRLPGSVDEVSFSLFNRGQYILNRPPAFWILPFPYREYNFDLVGLDRTKSICITATDMFGSPQVKKAFIFGTAETISDNSRAELRSKVLNVYWERRGSSDQYRSMERGSSSEQDRGTKRSRGSEQGPSNRQSNSNCAIQ